MAMFRAPSRHDSMARGIVQVRQSLMTVTSQTAPADAVARTWVDRAPGAIQPYLRLMRLDGPIGTWLLFWPSVLGLALGAAATGHGFDSWRDGKLILLFAIGSLVMRGAGCTFNDI